jgi:hypothetical protein
MEHKKEIYIILFRSKIQHTKDLLVLEESYGPVLFKQSWLGTFQAAISRGPPLATALWYAGRASILATNSFILGNCCPLVAPRTSASCTGKLIMMSMHVNSLTCGVRTCSGNILASKPSALPQLLLNKLEVHIQLRTVESYS